MNPNGPEAGRIATLWWFMFGVAAFVVVLVGVLVLAGVTPRRRDLPVATTAGGSHGAGGEEPGWARRMIFIGGFAFPVVVLAILWVWTLGDLAATSSPTRAAFTIDVIGHRWWWEVRYPAQRVTTANDVHIPVGRRVDIRLTTTDVLHSFWVPQLAAKTDMVPGRVNHMWVQAERPGVYRGQCAEFCGLQHANMAFFVVADQPAEFDRWLANQRRPAAIPTDPSAARGRDVFLQQACVGCHTIRGTPADARVGPDLTHIASRLSIGAGTIANTPGDLAAWILDAQDLKPGSLMPPIQLSGDDLRALLAYLGSLR